MTKPHPTTRTIASVCHPDRSGPAFAFARFLRAGPRSGGIAARLERLGSETHGQPIRCAGATSANVAAADFRPLLRVFVCAVLVTWIGLPVLLAQSNPASGDDPRVQQLYAEAKSAEARGDFAQASAKYESLLQIAPRLAAAYNNLGALYLRQREYQKAAAVLEKGLKLDPKMNSATALLGVSLYEMGEFAGARPKLEAALHANPKDDNAELFLANDLLKLGDYDSAASHLHALSRREPKNPEIWYLLGKVHMKLSEQALGKLNEIDPDSVWVHEISGEVMESMKNYDGALLEYKKAVELAPQQAGTHYLLGNAYWSLRIWDSAMQEFRAELANDPSNCAAEWKIGNAMLEQRQDPAEALATVDRALARCPRMAEARVDRGRALMRLDRNEEAVKELLIAEKADPAEPGTHFLLAQALRASGHPQEAQAQMQIFSKLEESARAKTSERAKQLLQEKDKPQEQKDKSP
jgi:tetratricopeptide (TPR) repeat protein